MKDPRMIFGFVLLLIVAVLIVIIALGHVEEKTSYGLQDLIGCLTTLTGGFAVWCFTKKTGD